MRQKGEEMNIILLKEKISEKGIRQEELATVLGIDRSTLYRKLKTGGDFSIKEATQMAKELNLTASEVNAIFFE